MTLFGAAPAARSTAALRIDQERQHDDREAQARENPGRPERLEEKLNLLATIAQIAPLLGLFGTVVGFIDIFGQVEQAGLYSNLQLLSHGVWKALICAAAGIGLAIPAHAGYNYLVSRVNKIVLDMERAAAEIVNIIAENGNGK